MSVEFENKEFSRVGRKSKNADGTDVEDKYTAKQVKEGSIAKDTAENLLTDILTVCDGDLSKAAEYFESGANHHMRLAAGGYDEWQKAAKKLADLPPFKGKSLEQIVAFLKASAV